MIWAIFAVIATLLFAVANYFDKYILEKKLQNPSPLTYMAISGSMGLVITLFLAGMASNVLYAAYATNYVVAFLAGLIFTAGMGIYFKALTIAETSLTASLFQLTILWNILFGALFLNEHLQNLAYFGIGLLVIATFYLAHQIDEDGRRRFHKEAFAIMLVACLLISVSDVLFKVSVQDGGNFIISQAFEYAAMTIVGFVLLATHKRVRDEIVTAFRIRPLAIVTLVLVNEVIVFGGTILSRLSIVNLDIAVAQAVLGVQPLFLITIGYVLTKLWPHRIHENVLRKHVAIKLSMAALIIVAELIIVAAI